MRAKTKKIEYLDVDLPIGPGWDEMICMRCGDEIKHNQDSVTAKFNPNATDEMERRMVGSLHTWCALRDGYRLRWPA